MTRWACWIALIYGLILVILFVPLLTVAQVSLEDLKSVASFLKFVKEMAGPLQQWQYWLTIVILILAQAALLRIPVAVNSGRPIKKSPVILMVIASGLMMGLLIAGATLTVLEVAKSGLFNESGAFFIPLAIMWLFWAWVFWRWSRILEPKSLVERICRWSFRGSVLELLVAVPCHIYVRHRNDCCAGFGTFCGIAFGLAVMLFSFGPGIFFLYAQRIKKLRAKP